MTEDQDAAVRRARNSASRLQWLRQNGCELFPETLDELQRLVSRIPDWTDQAAAYADHSFEGYGGWVGRNTDSTSIAELPVSEIIPALQHVARRSFDTLVENDPFEGLIRDRPRKALAALSYAARRADYPVAQWQSIISHWPEQAAPRLRWAFANRLGRLPAAVLRELRFYGPSWLRKHMPMMVANEQRDMWPVWDSLYAACSSPPEITKSSLGETTIGGIRQKRSRRNLSHALNSPIGSLTDCLVLTANQSKATSRGPLPKAISTRLERCLTTIGEGGDHAAAMIAQHLVWFHAVDPMWTTRVIVPLFAGTSTQAEPCWDAFLHRGTLGQRSLFAQLKPGFLDAFKLCAEFGWDEGTCRRLGELLVGAYAADAQGERLITLKETRTALQDGNEACRLGALHQIWILLSDRPWSTFEAFFSAAWPREARFQTSATSTALLNISTRVSNDFPAAIAALAPFLRPTSRAETFIFSCANPTATGAGLALATKFPATVLEVVDLILDPNSSQPPYDLGKLLEAVRGADPSLEMSATWRRLSDRLRRV